MKNLLKAAALVHNNRLPCRACACEPEPQETKTESDAEQKTPNDEKIVYRAVCTEAVIEEKHLLTYGIQLLSGRAGRYRVTDTISDVSSDKTWLSRLVDRLNCEKVAAVHFRDVVEDALISEYTPLR